MSHLAEFDFSSTDADSFVRYADDPGVSTTIGFRNDVDLDSQWRWLATYLGVPDDEATLRQLDFPPGTVVEPDKTANGEEYQSPDHRYTALVGILRTVKSRCKTIVVEHGYVDYDWQSEHAATWSKRHDERAPRVPRLHFFAEDLVDTDIYAIPEGTSYLGYAILRPVTTGVVGRSLISPPPSLNAQRLCVIEESPSLFGMPLPVRGVPFVQQDGEYLRCAHTAIWQVQHTAHPRDLAIQRTTAHIVELAGDASAYRFTPSEGLTSEQVQKALTAIGLPAIFYGVERVPDPPVPLAATLEEEGEAEPAYEWGGSGAPPNAVVLRERLTRLCCRYTNSGFPVVIGSQLPSGEHHSFTVVGWRDPQPRTDKDGKTLQLRRTSELIVCDDQRGPYEIMADPLHDVRGAWVTVMVPLPEEVKVTGEGAEVVLFELAENSADAVGEPREGQDVDGFLIDLAQLSGSLELIGNGEYSVRTTLVRGRDLKRHVRSQQRSPDVERIYRRADLPRWVWVVELHHRKSRDKPGSSVPSVVAEVIVDCTAHDRQTRTLLACSQNHVVDGALAEMGLEHVQPLSNPGMWLALPAPALVTPDSRVDEQIERVSA